MQEFVHVWVPGKFCKGQALCQVPEVKSRDVVVSKQTRSTPRSGEPMALLSLGAWTVVRFFGPCGAVAPLEAPLHTSADYAEVYANAFPLGGCVSTAFQNALMLHLGSA